MFHGLSLFGGASLVFVLCLVTGQWTKSSCQFSVSGRQDTPRIVGPKEIVDRIILLTQPDSPLEIVSADFSDAIFVLDGERSYFEDGYTIGVRNRSDRPVLGFNITVHIRSRSGGAGGGVVWEGMLSPGGVVDVSLPPGRGHSEITTLDGNVAILLWVDSVEFDDCEYNPSKGLKSFRKFQP